MGSPGRHRRSDVLEGLRRTATPRTPATPGILKEYRNKTTSVFVVVLVAPPRSSNPGLHAARRCRCATPTPLSPPRRPDVTEARASDGQDSYLTFRVHSAHVRGARPVQRGSNVGRNGYESGPKVVPNGTVCRKTPANMAYVGFVLPRSRPRGPRDRSPTGRP